MGAQFAYYQMWRRTAWLFVSAESPDEIEEHDELMRLMRDLAHQTGAQST